MQAFSIGSPPPRLTTINTPRSPSNGHLSSHNNNLSSLLNPSSSGYSRPNSIINTSYASSFLSIPMEGERSASSLSLDSRLDWILHVLHFRVFHALRRPFHHARIRAIIQFPRLDLLQNRLTFLEHPSTSTS